MAAGEYGSGVLHESGVGSRPGAFRVYACTKKDNPIFSSVYTLTENPPRWFLPRDKMCGPVF